MNDDHIVEDDIHDPSSARSQLQREVPGERVNTTRQRTKCLGLLTGAGRYRFCDDTLLLFD